MTMHGQLKDVTDVVVKNATRKLNNDQIKALLGSKYAEYRKAREPAAINTPPPLATEATSQSRPPPVTPVPKKTKNSNTASAAASAPQGRGHLQLHSGGK